jgi:hypothetical protein
MNYKTKLSESSVYQVMCHMTHEFKQVSIMFARYARISTERAKILLGHAIANYQGGCWTPMSKKVKMLNWLGYCIGLDELDKYHYGLVKYPIPDDLENKIKNFLTVLWFAVSEVYHDLWVVDMPDPEMGYALSEWIDIKKNDLMKVFYRNWKAEQRLLCPV